MEFEVLLSCMHQKDTAIVKDMGITSPILVINQCDEDARTENGNIRMISVPERGLSKSRNLALKEAKGRICLLADDDEVMEEGLEEKVLAAFEEIPDADVIAFKVMDFPSRLGDRKRQLKRSDALKVYSKEIAFKRESVAGRLSFDENLGAGTGNGGGEDNKFVLDCMKAGLKVFYMPVSVARVDKSGSTWFSGYDGKFFHDRGRTTRYILGMPLSFMYAIYYAITKRGLYKDEISAPKALGGMLKGIFAKKIGK